tara:strand:+ start:298 stop:1158 length:861 start_codon:yes stop_codon:yes gene_type:complete
MAYRLTGSRTKAQSAGSPRANRTERGALVGFDIYFDKGIKKMIKDWGVNMKESVNQAIMDGYRDAFIKAKTKVAEHMTYQGGRKTANVKVGGLPPIDTSIPRLLKKGEVAKSRFGNQQQLVDKTNFTGDVSGVQRIWDSLGFTIMQERGRYITAVAGSSDWDNRGYQYTGVTARSTPSKSLNTTLNRKPPGGFNLAEYYEDGLSPFQYNFKDIGNRPGITPSPSYLFEARPGLVTLVKKAFHPGFKDISAVFHFREHFVDELKDTVLTKLGMRGVTDLNFNPGGMI